MTSPWRGCYNCGNEQQGVCTIDGATVKGCHYYRGFKYRKCPKWMEDGKGDE